MSKIIEDNNFLKFTKLSEYDELIHLYTKRPFCVRIDDNKDEKISWIEKQINYHFDTYQLAKQEHTTNVVKITEGNKNDNFTSVDGFITNLANIALLTKTADCQAILLYDPVKKVIGNIHSGWKGTLNKIIVNAINIMTNDYNSNPKDIIACISPSILKCCFEVDEDLMLQFKNNFFNIDEDIYLGEIKEGKQKYFIDTVNINKKEMMSLGLLEQNIITSDICTKCECETYHSYRASHNDERNIALICLKP